MLPAFSRPYEDEVLSSWLTRLAFDNGLNRRMLLTGAGLKLEGKTDFNIDHLNDIGALDVLSDYANCSSDAIRNASLHYYNNKLFTVKNNGIIPLIWQAKRPVSIFNDASGQGNLLFCPSCLARRDHPVYYRRKWRLSISFVCLQCKCYLREVCPHCSKPSSKMRDVSAMADYKNCDRYLLACGTCKGDISKCIPQTAPEHIIRMQQQINNYLDQPYSTKERYSVGYFKVVHGIARMLLKNSLNLRYGPFVSYVYHQTQTVDYRLDHRNADLADLTVRQRADVFRMAMWLLEEWPGRLTKLCIKYRLNQKSMLSIVPDAPLWYYNAIGDLPDGTSKEDRVPKRWTLSVEDLQSIEDRRRRWRYDIDVQEEYYDGNTSYIDPLPEYDRTRDLYEMLYVKRYRSYY